MGEEFQCCGFGMPMISKGVGLVLSVWGIAAYIISDMASVTAMIPTFIGAPILLMGFLSEKMPEKRKLFMHIAAVFGVFAVIGSTRIFSMLGGDYGLTFFSLLLLMVLGVFYTVVCVKSFIHARKSREAAE
jgi:hypothetical protein